MDGGLDFCDAPSSMNGQRACMRCGLVKCFNQFYDSGCENCPFLELEERQDLVQTCTTSNFEGMVMMINPNDSWISRWEGISSFVPGVYAAKITGELPDHVRAFLHDKHISSRAHPDAK
ncbi:transcription elongation factor SPT4 [Pelagophyceae sp. CCMP2097]|nr:transcription elongation factor SPT4 [Pelagophyceae sp. CCMP2097]|mmetsp:Transcript_15888/g.53542  ORF Transcript_15888/g.53542 Transcript_15888/m.53542 type:complete len:119 (+) Transcript_15888:59-415(+)